MFEFTLEWTNLRSRAERANDAEAVTDRIGIREALILPLVLLVAFLFALGIMTGAHLHTLLPSSDSCRRPLKLGSVPRLRHADLLALLTAD